MTAAPASSPAQAAGAPLTATLFVAAVFASASLVFMVEPMMARLVLPLLGGSAAVWNTSLAFFQAALLGGYVYAHLLQRIGSIRLQIVVHLAVLLAAGLVLPLKVTGLLGDPPPGQPALWLVGVLALSVGGPFAALSATAPLAQAWHARVLHIATGREPYGLYAASNVGSFLALLTYPALVEPNLTLVGQTLGWTVGYAGFFILLAALGLRLWRDASQTSGSAATPTGAAAAGGLARWRERGVWIALAALPSSLMLGVTSYITTDLGSAPFMWVAPLALYLATFVIAFSDRIRIPPQLTLVLQAGLLVVAAVFIHFRTGDFLQEVFLHLTTFFLTALICHQALVARRPEPGRLTEFYICMSLGGVLGGAFNAFLAPVLFNSVVEYPAALALSCLARPWFKTGAPTWRSWAIMTAGTLSAVVAFLVVHPPPSLQPALFKALGASDAVTLGTWILAVTALMAFLLRDRAWMFAPMVLVLLASAERVADRTDVIGTWRSFFGVLRESRGADLALGGEVHFLANGTTLHGAQAVNPAFRCTPLIYYAHPTPIGQVFDTVQATRPAVRIGAVGLGAGTVAAYVRPSDALTFFEIDPLMVRLSTTARAFTYTSDCARGRLDYVLGDARLTLNRQPAGQYDILLIDAFSSDSVPAHLLTVQAVRMYLSKLKPDGVVILHLSNRNLDLIRPAEAVALAAGGYPLFQSHDAPRGWRGQTDTPEDALIITRSEAALAPFRADRRWVAVQPDGVRAWTDDYTNLFGAMVRRLKGRG
ncbi:fused MFS/spermidine synthase [Caulobacter sp. KR2-114]|uniref:fused MFS/spermidine synthase n=1 Tax=Caulobacter sp. KR2-114 TaxID=3400912 RepID=UPI003C04D9DA